jgi:hypothetical protein
MAFLLHALLLLAAAHGALSAKAWPGDGVKRIKNIVTFGDSYTGSHRPHLPLLSSS